MSISPKEKPELKLEKFELERMQSDWEFQVEYDMSESGITPLTLREVCEMGLDLESFLDLPYGYSQTNGTIELRRIISSMYPGTSEDNVEVTNGTSEANLLVALSALRHGGSAAFQAPNYMQMRGVCLGLGAEVSTFPMILDSRWKVDWEAFYSTVRPGTKLVYLSNPHNPTGSVLDEESMLRIVERCEEVGAWLLSDEVYRGAELDGHRTKSFWGMSDRVIITSGLSKAFGIPGVRIGWIVGPEAFIRECWSDHDYITICPNKLSDKIARVVLSETNRERCLARTREVLKNNLPIVRSWAQGLSPILEWQEPEAGAFTLFKYNLDIPSRTLGERIRQNQNTLIVPGAMMGLERHIRVSLGAKEEYLRAGLDRIGRELQKIAKGQ